MTSATNSFQAFGNSVLNQFLAGSVNGFNPTNAGTRMEGGKVQFENDNYRITMGDNNEVMINNKNTGESYQIWGDPHVNIDGKHTFDFWGTTTFKLDDGTAVTIQTTPWNGSDTATVASTVTITNGDYGVQVSGVDTNTMGDLRFSESKGWGQLLDAVVDDGNQLFENSLGKGFLGVDGCGNVKSVDQNFINQSDLLRGGNLSEGSHFGVNLQNGMNMLQKNFAPMLSLSLGIMSIGFIGAFLSGISPLSALLGDDGKSSNTPAFQNSMWAGGSPAGQALERGIFQFVMSIV